MKRETRRILQLALHQVEHRAEQRREQLPEQPWEQVKVEVKVEVEVRVEIDAKVEVEMKRKTQLMIQASTQPAILLLVLLDEQRAVHREIQLRVGREVPVASYPASRVGDQRGNDQWPGRDDRWEWVLGFRGPRVQAGESVLQACRIVVSAEIYLAAAFFPGPSGSRYGLNRCSSVFIRGS
jgi:hypothetical protein